MTITKRDYLFNILVIFYLTRIAHVTGSEISLICWLIYTCCFLQLLILILVIINEKLKEKVEEEQNG